VHSGCFFHYNQAIYRRIQQLGLTVAYSEDEHIRSVCRQLMALPLLPLDQVEHAFYNLRASLDASVKKQLRQLFLYFDNYWMTGVSLEIWNVHGHQYRTNNVCEGMSSYLYSTKDLICNFRISQ
jgi:hypothetical protein